MLLLMSALAVSAPPAPLCNLNGNWTSSTHAGAGIVHIEFFQPEGKPGFTLRVT